jgi:hypothetical protein
MSTSLNSPVFDASLVSRRLRRPGALGRVFARKAGHAFERLVMPPMTSTAQGRDFRRVVSLVAALAVGFFAPSLALAGVPPDIWPQFLAVAAFGGLAIALSMFFVARSPAVAIAIGVTDAAAVVALAWVYRGYYNEIPLLFALIVAALAVVHGLSAAVPAIILGGLLVPLMAQPGTTNPTDPINAVIYLSGSAAVPWAAARLAERRSTALQRQLRATRATEREAVLILARAAEAKDEVTGDHVARVGDLAATLAAAVGSNPGTVEGVRFAAMLHDVGKLHVPDSILMKPGRLNPEEWDVMRQHTIWGPRILGDSAGFELARVIARSHHENWDGSGYPDGLRGEKIPIEARMVRLTDAFDALRNARPYKPAWSIERCLEELEAGRGSSFDPELTPVFIGIAQRLYASELALGRSAEAVEAAAGLVPVTLVPLPSAAVTPGPAGA